MKDLEGKGFRDLGAGFPKGMKDSQGKDCHKKRRISKGIRDSQGKEFGDLGQDSLRNSQGKGWRIPKGNGGFQWELRIPLGSQQEPLDHSWLWSRFR